MMTCIQRLSVLLLMVFFALPAQGAPPQAHENRVLSADLIRLSSFSNGRITAGAPAFDTAIGKIGKFGFGNPGCDSAGFDYRAIVHGKAGVNIRVPQGAQRMVIILRPTHGLRELTVRTAVSQWPPLQLTEGWQRVSLPLDESHEGEHFITFDITQAGKLINEAPSMPRQTRALVHAILFKRNATRSASTSPQKRPVTEKGMLWLETHEILEIPVPLQRYQALQSGGVRIKGNRSKLALEVSARSAEGAFERLLTVPGHFQLPWNLDLSRRGERTPIWLRFEAKGTELGHIGLKTPALTVPGKATGPVVRRTTKRPIVLIAIRNLTATDAQAVAASIEAVPLTRAWTTATDNYAALVSLITGRYPSGNGVFFKRQSLDAAIPTLATLMKQAKRETLLTGGVFPGLGDPATSQGFDRVLLPQRGGLRPHAASILAQLARAIGQAQQHFFGLAVLGDPGSNTAPRTKAWRRYASGITQPPWPPQETRQRLIAMSKSKKKPSAEAAKYIRALQLGVIHETLHAVKVFLQKMKQYHRPLVVIAGLGRTKGPLTPASAEIPVWIVDTDNAYSHPSATLDLTDLAALVLRAAGSTAQTQGTDPLHNRQEALPGTAFVATPQSEGLVTAGPLALTIKANKAQTLFEKKKDGRWSAVPKSATQAFLSQFLLRMNHAHGGAGARWNAAAYDPTMTIGSEWGVGSVCGQ